MVATSAAHAPVNSFQKHRQLRRRDASFVVVDRRPDKPSILKAFYR